MKILDVLLDPGHGASTAGKRSPVWPNGRQLFEYKFNRELAAKIAEECKKFDFLRPVIIVNTNEDVGLSKRARLANAYSASKSVFLSIHGNASSSESASGWEIHTSPGKTKADDLADCIWLVVDKAYNNGTRKLNWNAAKMKMRGDLRDGDYDWESKFTVLMKTNMPAVLLENGFFTNYDECMNMLDPAWQSELAFHIVQGIVDYYHRFYAK